MSPLDTALLGLEGERTPIHVGSVSMVAGPAPSDADLARLIESRLHLVPRLRQLVVPVPGGLARPVWADDGDFDVHRHLRRTALPGPGAPDQLNALVGRVIAEPLEATRPLWELWAVEGLAGGRWALITKVHHAMVDGIAGSALLDLLLDDDPHRPPPGEPQPWCPAGSPSRGRLVRGALSELATAPRTAASGVRAAAGALTATGTGRARITGLNGPNGFLGLVRRPRPTVPGLTGPTGPDRSWSATGVPLASVDRTRQVLGGTVNDVVLAATTRGFRDLLLARGTPLAGRHVRSLVPVSVRAADERGGNRATGVLVDLPVGEPDPLARYRQLQAQMTQLKGAGQARDADSVLALLAAVPAPLTALGFRSVFALPQAFIQTVTTNVPGPATVRYLLGRRLETLHPYLPLAWRLRIAVAVLTYDEQIGFGVTAEPAVVPDAGRLIEGIEAGLAELALVAERST